MGGKGEIMLFGVRVAVDSLRKSVSLNNLSQYALPPSSSSSAAVDATSGGGGGGGYASADEAVPSRSFGSRSERKRGVPWTEEEHKLFLMGLKKVGKGDWRGISRNYVKTRTPTQVASHAQKYFLRHTNHNRRRRRTSLFDITTDAVYTNPAAEEEQAQDQDKNKTGIQSQPLPPETSNVPNFSVLQSFPATSTTTATPVPVVNQAEKLLPVVEHSEATNPSTGTMLLFPILPLSCTSPVGDLNLDLNLRPIPEPLQLSLNLSLASDQRESIISVS